MARQMTVAKLKGVHAHGCRNCHTRYEDVCEEPLVNGSCIECKTGQPFGMTTVIADRFPKECCRQFSRLARIDECEKYRLGGDAPWYVCAPASGGCARTHPYDDPRKMEVFA